MNTIPADVKALLDQHDWDNTIPRLIKYALTKIRHMYWYQEPGGQVAAGKMAEDFVMDAILKVYKGQRQWDPQTMPDLLIYLFGVLRSEINHHSHSLENRCLQFMDALSDQRKKHIESQQAPAIHNSFIEGFMSHIKDDAELSAVVPLLAAGHKPKRIAEELSMNVTDVYNLRKILRRRLRNYLIHLKSIK